MRLIKTRFASTCAETGNKLPKGVNAMYDPTTKKVYAMYAKKSIEALEESEEDKDARNTSAYIQAQEDAFFNNQFR